MSPSAVMLLFFNELTIQELPDVKSDELSTINAELKKLGISGDRSELTEAGRYLDIQEVRKRRVDVRQDTSLFTVKEVSQSHGFALNFGMRTHTLPRFFSERLLLLSADFRERKRIKKGKWRRYTGTYGRIKQ